MKKLLFALWCGLLLCSAVQAQTQIVNPPEFPAGDFTKVKVCDGTGAPLELDLTLAEFSLDFDKGTGWYLYQALLDENHGCWAVIAVKTSQTRKESAELRFWLVNPNEGNPLEFTERLEKMNNVSIFPVSSDAVKKVADNGGLVVHCPANPILPNGIELTFRVATKK